MDFREPFLFRFKQPCSSPERAQPDDRFFYDHALDQVLVIVDGSIVPVIEADLSKGPTTKKGDIEKGEDVKDRWMWR